MLFRKFAVDFAEKYRLDPIQVDEQARRLLETYSWPGNIRELKNIAEQISILSEKRLLEASDLSQLMPQITQRHLPSIQKEGDKNQFQERELLYKVLFDMKKDLNDLKSLIFELIRTNELKLPNDHSIRSLSPSTTNISSVIQQFDQGRDNTPKEDNSNLSFDTPSTFNEDDYSNEDSDHHPIILNAGQQQAYDQSTVIDENLSLEDNEKDLINKALKKHQGHRREAALDLGISERTLYRKIEKYEL